MLRNHRHPDGVLMWEGTMSVSVRIAGQEDLGAVYERAVGAAKRGDVDGLEVELTSLRRLKMAGSGTVGTTLRAMARCARAHPSMQPAD
jgi:fumarylacetoacetate (FAA) hydrolase family protein